MIYLLQPSTHTHTVTHSHLHILYYSAPASHQLQARTTGIANRNQNIGSLSVHRRNIIAEVILQACGY